MLIKNPGAIFRRHLRLAPGHPLGERVLVRELPPAGVTEGGIAMAEEAMERLFAGEIVAAGDQAADVMYDAGQEIGDTILYAKYAGLIEDWRHIVGNDDPKCQHDGAWDRVPKRSATLAALGAKADLAAEKKWMLAGGESENRTLRECRACGTLMISDRVLVMSIDDIIMNVDLQERLESGAMKRVFNRTAEGKTRHELVRCGPDGREIEKQDSFETRKVAA